jgi:Ca2+/Na+ antiporter
MLTEKEKLFVEYWESYRMKEKSIFYQLMTGLPMGLLFSLPIIFVLFSGRYWYKRADFVANSKMSVWVLLLAVLLIAVFVAFMYKRHKWEMKDQQYNELKARSETKS